MDKNRKIKSYQSKKHNCQHKYWWVVCVYLFVPVILIVIFGKIFACALQDFMAGVRVGEGRILNSKYAIDNIIYPFIESFMIIMGAIISYVILRLLRKKLLKRKIYFAGASKCLKYFEISMVLLGVMIAVYGKINDFDYSQYGFNVATIAEAQYIHLEKIPRINSVGISIQEGDFFYNMLLHMSQFVFYLSDNLEMIIAIAGTVIIPLKSYSEEVEWEEKCRELSKGRNRCYGK